MGMGRESDMPKEVGARLSVKWGYDVDVELSVSKRKWSKITRGHDVTIRGSGYYYEGDFFWDYWHFSGGLDGRLTVSYGSPKDVITVERASSARRERHSS
jgi:hypothetical protein